MFYGEVNGEVVNPCKRCEEYPTCSEYNCIKPGNNGAHVYDKTHKTLDNPNACLIIACCNEHNPAPPKNEYEENGVPSTLHYPTKMLASESCQQNFIRNKDLSVSPGQIMLSNGKPCVGMRVKKNTFAARHCIGRMEITNKEQRQLMGKGQGKGARK